MADAVSGAWRRVPLTLHAVVGGLLVGMIAANVWPLLLLKLGAGPAAAVEALLLAAYLWWFLGLAPGPWRAGRRELGRWRRLTAPDWAWGLLAALAFAASVHAAMVVLFRLVPFPAAAFHAGYDLAFIPTQPMRWLACVVSALSAGVCEEMGFRGYMQRPIETRHGAVLAIAISSVLFMLIHLNKSWSLLAMTPIVLGAGVMLGLLARRSRSLVFCMLGHWAMDIGLFAYWWTQIAGVFPQRPVWETGLDASAIAEVAVLAGALGLFAIALRQFPGAGRPGLSGPEVAPATA
jgi:membrane protease YdiL (CAAX protease family)